MLVFMRMILKFLEANSESFIVFHLYGFTDLVVWPFKAIFPDSFLWGRPLDVVAISAMIGYFILYLLIIKVLTLLIKE
jgi:hypothetical protein